MNQGIGAQPAGIIADTEVKRESHVEITDAIESLDFPINQLTSLIERIRGIVDESKCGTTPPIAVPNLAEFLQNAEGNIREKGEKMGNLISELESQLF